MEEVKRDKSTRGAEMIKKTFLKKICFNGFFMYDISLITAGGDVWFEAVPVTPGCVTRTANTEKELKAILQNDVNNVVKFNQRTR